MAGPHFSKGEAVSVRRKFFSKEIGKVIQVVNDRNKDAVIVWVQFPGGNVEGFSPAEIRSAAKGKSNGVPRR
jgi:hypothetical protein